MLVRIHGCFVGIGYLPGNDASYAYAVNADGSVVVGDSQLLNSGIGSAAFRWTASTGPVSLGNFSASGVNADGSVVVGTAGSAVISANPQAIRWTASSGVVGLGFPAGSIASAAVGVNGDGSVVVGNGFSSGFSEAFVWTASTGPVGLGVLPGAISSTAKAVSSDGSVVVGGVQRFGGVNDEAFRWTASTGMVGLGFLTGDSFSQANAANGDGSVVVGAGGVAGTSVYRAFRWTSATGMQSVQDILTANEVGLVGWQNMIAFGVSADGTVIAGTGTDPNGKTEAWLARIPVDAFALLDLAGVDHSLGSLVWGGTVTNSSTSPATLTIGSDNANTTFIGVIQDGTGTTALDKKGTATTILTGTSTYSGGTTISGGTLQIGNGGTTGSILGNVTDNADLAFNRSDNFTFGGLISGTGTVSQFGPGQLILTSANTYAGGTTVSNGTLVAGNNSAFGTGMLAMAAGTTLSFLDTANFTISNPITIAGDPFFTPPLGATQTLSGVISDGGSPGSLDMQGSGTLVLSGTNTYYGVTNINAGALRWTAHCEFEPDARGKRHHASRHRHSRQHADQFRRHVCARRRGRARHVDDGLRQPRIPVRRDLSGAGHSTSATFANVTGTASLSGNVLAAFAAGSYLTKQYTILHSAGLKHVQCARQY